MLPRKKAELLLLFTLFFICSGLALATNQYSRRTPIVEAYDANKDAVVSILGAKTTQVNDFFNFGWDDFPFGPRRNMTQTSLGSGFIINPHGYVITNAHVVEADQEITVVMADGAKYKANIVARSPSRDLAVLKINADKALPIVKLGTSSDLLIGETVLAIGNPFGYQQTLTDGIISAIHRDLELGESQVLGDLIQISAPINPGNSGGPLLNINGEIIGINTAIRKAAQGIGFAIPIDQLRQSLPSMLDIETIYRADFGAEVSDLKSEVRSQKSEERSKNENSQRATRNSELIEGVQVRSIRPESAAARARLQVGDIITTVSGEKIHSAIDFYLLMLEQKLGQEFKLTVQRGSPAQETQLAMLLKERPKPDGTKLAQQLFGLKVEHLTRAMLQQYRKIYGEPGNVLIVSVEQGSPAERAGLKAGDVIAGLAGIEIKNLEQLGLALENTTPDTSLKIVVYRTQQLGRNLFPVAYTTAIHVRKPGEKASPETAPAEEGELNF